MNKMSDFIVAFSYSIGIKILSSGTKKSILKYIHSISYQKLFFLKSIEAILRFFYLKL